MKKQLFTICLMLFFLMCSLFFGMLVYAEQLDFSVRTILPNNQRSEDTSYFDLRVEPGEVYHLEVELTNDTNQEVTVITAANSAITNDNGVADYSHKKTEKDSSAEVTFSEISKMPEEITLPPNSKKIVECILTMPEQLFDGYILGGLYFEQKEGASEESKKNAIVAVGNRFSYIIGVLLSETDKEVKPELALNDVRATKSNGNNQVIMNIQNKQAAMIKNLTVDAELYYENEEKARYENHQANLVMAPNTNFNYQIDLKNQVLASGNYKVKIKANDGMKDWHWEKNFQVKGIEHDSQSANNSSSEKKPLTAGISLVLGLLVVFVGFILYKKKVQCGKLRKKADNIA